MCSHSNLICWPYCWRLSCQTSYAHQRHLPCPDPPVRWLWPSSATSFEFFQASSWLYLQDCKLSVVLRGARTGCCMTGCCSASIRGHTRSLATYCHLLAAVLLLGGLMLLCKTLLHLALLRCIHSLLVEVPSADRHLSRDRGCVTHFPVFRQMADPVLLQSLVLHIRRLHHQLPDCGSFGGGCSWVSHGTTHPGPGSQARQRL